MYVGNFELQFWDISDSESSGACKRFAQPASDVIMQRIRVWAVHAWLDVSIQA